VYGNADVSPIVEATKKVPTCPYGASKLTFEQLLHRGARTLGMRSTALRYFNAAGCHPQWNVGEIHQPEEHLIPRVIHAFIEGRAAQVYGQDYPTEDGTCVRDYVHVTDLASAHVRVLEAENLESGRSFNVGTGKGTPVLAVIRSVARQLGQRRDRLLPRRPGDPASDRRPIRPGVGTGRLEHSSIEIVNAIAWNGRADGMQPELVTVHTVATAFNQRPVLPVSKKTCVFMQQHYLRTSFAVLKIVRGGRWVLMRRWWLAATTLHNRTAIQTIIRMAVAVGVWKPPPGRDGSFRRRRCPRSFAGVARSGLYCLPATTGWYRWRLRRQYNVRTARLPRRSPNASSPRRAVSSAT
jgi:hypothetical protein